MTHMSLLKKPMIICLVFAISLAFLGCPNPTNPIDGGGGTVPEAPENFGAFSLSTSQIELSWTDNSDNEEDFLIERGPSESGPWTTVDTATAGSQSYLDDGLAGGTTYHYRLSARNSAGSSTTVLASSTTIGAGEPTFSVDDCWWSDSLDVDGDGYTDYRRLHTEVDVNDGLEHSVDLGVYRRLTGTSIWVFHDTIADIGITGDEEDSVWVDVQQLNQGAYDFRVVVYEDDVIKKAVYDFMQDADLDDQLFEKAGTPVLYWISDCWWSTGNDQDFDGYTTSRVLYMYIDVSAGYPSVEVRISYKASGDSTYTEYTTGPSFDLSYETSAICSFAINASSGLSHGSYDFLVEILHDGEVVASLGPDDDPLLNDQLFEENETIYSVADCWWSDEVDLDLDGYTTSRTLNTDVDVTEGPQSVYLKVYYKLYGSTDEYTLYDTTPSFSIITGESDSDAYALAFGSTGAGALPYDEYDFRVEVYQEGDDANIRATRTSGDSELYNEAFEESETAWPHSIRNCSWSDELDLDEDGYTYCRTLHVEVDVDDDSTRSVYLKISTREFIMNYAEYYTTPAYSITGTDDDEISVVIGTTPTSPLSEGAYDFKIEVYDEGDTTLKAVRSDATDEELNDQLFESFDG
jgi:hypothetical protein